MKTPFFSVVLTVCLAAALAGCAGGASTASSQQQPQHKQQSPTVTLSQSGSATTLDSGSKAVGLSATVDNDTTSAGVTWALQPASGCGTLTSNGLTASYTPPAESALNSNCTATITAASAALSTASSSLGFTIKAVAFAPLSAENTVQKITAGSGSLTLSEAIINDASGTAVANWSLSCPTQAQAMATLRLSQKITGGFSHLLARASAAKAVPDTTGSTCGTLSATSGESVTYTPPPSGATTATVTASISTNSSITQAFTINVEAPSAPSTYTVSGTVSGLSTGSSVTLFRNRNTADSVTVASNGAFVFPTAAESGSNYVVTVGTHPAGEFCTVLHGSGTGISSNVSDVQVECQPATTHQQMAQRALVQTSLGVGMTQEVLEMEITGVGLAMMEGQACTSLGPFSVETGSTPSATFTMADPAIPFYPATFFTDDACTQKYMSIVVNTVTGIASGNETNGNASVTLGVTLSYFDTNGNANGQLAMNETADLTYVNGAMATMMMHGIGTYSPANSAIPRSYFGLYCTIDRTSSSLYDIPCGGAVVQNIPSLNLSIGTVTPVNLTLANHGKDPDFAGNATFYTGKPDALVIENPDPYSLQIAGGTGFSAARLNGAMPESSSTAWTLQNMINGMELTYTAPRNSTDPGPLNIIDVSTGNTLATGKVNAFGNGSITFSDGTSDTISNWVLLDQTKM